MEEGRYTPLISGPHLLRTRVWKISRTCASCDADSGSGLRDGTGRRGASLPPSAAMVAMHSLAAVLGVVVGVLGCSGRLETLSFGGSPICSIVGGEE